MKLGDSFGEAWALVGRHPVPLLVPLLVLSLMFGVLNGSPSRAYEMNAPLALASFLTFVFLVLGAPFAWLVTPRAALDALSGNEPDLGSAWQSASHAFLARWWMLALVGALLSVAYALFVLPGVALAALLLPIAAVELAEGATGGAAWTRTTRLVGPHYWTLALAALALTLAFALAGSLSFVPVGGGVMAGLGVGLVAGYAATFSAVAYRRLADGA